MRFFSLLKKARDAIFDIFSFTQKKPRDDNNIKMRKSKKFTHIINYLEDTKMQSKEPDYIKQNIKKMTQAETEILFRSCQQPSPFHLKVIAIIAKAVGEKHIGHYSQYAAEYKHKKDDIWHLRQKEIKILETFLQDKFSFVDGNGLKVEFYDDTRLFNFCVDIANKSKAPVWNGLFGQNVLVDELKKLMIEASKGQVKAYTNTYHIADYQRCEIVELNEKINELEDENEQLASDKKTEKLKDIIEEKNEQIEQKNKEIKVKDIQLKNKDEKIKTLETDISNQQRHFDQQFSDQRKHFDKQVSHLNGVIEKQEKEIYQLNFDIKEQKSDFDEKLKQTEDRFMAIVNRLEIKIDHLEKENKKLHRMITDEEKLSDGSTVGRHSFFYSIGKERAEKQEQTLSCPITQEIFTDPVLAEDGIIYDREGIESYFSTSSNAKMKSPFNRALIGKSLKPVKLIKTIADDLKGQPKTNQNSSSASSSTTTIVKKH